MSHISFVFSQSPFPLLPSASTQVSSISSHRNRQVAESCHRKFSNDLPCKSFGAVCPPRSALPLPCDSLSIIIAAIILIPLRAETCCLSRPLRQAPSDSPRARLSSPPLNVFPSTSNLDLAPPRRPRPHNPQDIAVSTHSPRHTHLGDFLLDAIPSPRQRLPPPFSP